MGDFVMPSLGADMDTGTVAEWRVRPGSVVQRGDIVAVVDTEKSDIEVEVFEDGVVEELLVEEGAEVAVGTPLARIRPTDAPPAADGPPPLPVVERVRASPRARREAVRRGTSLAGVVGSGPGGAIVSADLEPAPAPDVKPDVTPRPASDRAASLRAATASLMAASKREIPHYYLGTTVDLAAATAWLDTTNADRPVTARLLPAALLLKATALAAGDAPALNGTWHDGFRPSATVDLGVAVALRGGGLVAPAIPEADTLSLDDLMAALRDVVVRARAGRLRSSEVAGASITVTNLGDLGVDEVFGVIYPPQVALVGLGRIVDTPVAVDGMLAIRPTLHATLSADHRASDGRQGSRFLAQIDRLLQTPEEL